MRLIAAFILTALGITLMSSAEATDADNVRTAKRVFLEKMGQGRFNRLDEIYGLDFVAHSATKDYTLKEDNASGKEWRAAFPDLKVTVERTAASNNLVAVHWKATGTNTAARAGFPGKG